MGIDVTVTIGGAAGQGIQTVGDLLANVCHRAGLYVMAINDFESRIRGGHSFIQLRISDKPVTAADDQIHLLVAFSSEAYDAHAGEIPENGRILVENATTEEKPGKEKIITVAFTSLAEEAGGKIMANTVAAGAVLGMLGAPGELLGSVLEDQFGKKPASVLEKNLKAADLGRNAVTSVTFEWKFDWPDREPRGKLLSGARALALGALAADCRVAAFYPMSPATAIMVNLAEFTDRFPLIVEQAEDEIAAINMTIGASFAGVRSMTATSGGGFALMAEGLGLAAITETPIVIINSQRPGPATGLPTRTAQADLQFMIHAAQDEFPRFVLAPRTLDEGFETMIRAFHLTEKYQVPVIVLVDQYFNDSMSIATDGWRVPETIERFLITDNDMPDPAAYKRFAITESGVSPRALPCAGKALVIATSDEHGEDGHMTEKISDRNGQFNKRNKKKRHSMESEINGPESYFGDARLLLVTWGSTDGVVREAVDRLRGEGYDAGAVVYSDLWPFPTDQTTAALSRCERFIMVELNASAQLGALIRQHTGLTPTGAIVRYDGRPMKPGEVAKEAGKYGEKRK